MFNWITARSVSLLIVLAYLAFALVAASQGPVNEAIGSVIVTMAYLLLPLACIWFGDEMGDYIGTLPGPAINRRSPGWMVKIGGWFLLFFPVLIFFIGWLS